jgi:rhodanese-related sulfurtransferase
MSLTIVIVTFIISTIFLLFRFSNRNIKLGAGQAADLAAAKVREGAILLDVRSPSEFRDGSLPGAENIPVDQIAGSLDRIPRDRAVVVFCASGGRSSSARDILVRSGYQDVTNAGGLRDLELALSKKP